MPKDTFDPIEPTIDLNELIKGATSNITEEDLDDIVPLTNKKEGGLSDDSDEDTFFIGGADDIPPTDQVTVVDEPKHGIESEEVQSLRAQVQQLLDLTKALQDQVKDVHGWKEEISNNAVESVISGKEKERRSALLSGDFQTALALEDEIADIKKQIETQKQQKTNNIPQVDPEILKVQDFINRNKTELDSALSKIHKLNYPDFSKVSDFKKSAMRNTLQLVVINGVRAGKNITEIANDYADALNLNTVKPVNRTSKQAVVTGKQNKDTIENRFNNLPAEARKMWLKGGYNRIYQGDLEAYVNDSEKTFKGN